MRKTLRESLLPSVNQFTPNIQPFSWKQKRKCKPQWNASKASQMSIWHFQWAWPHPHTARNNSFAPRLHGRRLLCTDSAWSSTITKYDQKMTPSVLSTNQRFYLWAIPVKYIFPEFSVHRTFGLEWYRDVMHNGVLPRHLLDSLEPFEVDDEISTSHHQMRLWLRHQLKDTGVNGPYSLRTRFPKQALQIFPFYMWL